MSREKGKYKLLEKLAKNSFALVNILFSLSFIIAFIVKCFYDGTSIIFLAIFFLNVGIYIGYCLAYYSIKYIQHNDIKKSLPLN